jgi:hypothetical protein
MKHIEALKYEVSVLKTRLMPHDTGHIHTAISVLEDRIKEIELDSYNKQDLDLSIVKCRMEIDSPYNDGWTREFYQSELKRLEELKSNWDHYSDLPAPSAYT